MKLALQIGKKKSRMSFENSSGFLQDDGSGYILRQNHAKVKSFQCHGITGYFLSAVISKPEVELLTFTKLSSFLMSFMDKSTSAKLRQGWKVDKRPIWCQTKRYPLLLSKRRGSPWLWKGKQSGSSCGETAELQGFEDTCQQNDVRGRMVWPSNHTKAVWKGAESYMERRDWGGQQGRS